MIYTSIYFYFISVAIASFTIYLSYEIYREYRLHYLSYWFYYIIFLNLGFFFFYTIRFLVLDVLKLDPWQTEKFHILLFVFLLRPVIIIGLYLFIKFACGLIEKKLSGLVKKGYILFCIVHSLILLWLTFDYFETKNGHTLNAIGFLSDWITVLAFYAGIGYIIYHTKDIKDPHKQMAVRMFSYIFFICQTVFILTSNYAIKLLLSFAYILPSLLYLKRFLRKYFREYSPIREMDARAGDIFSKYNISLRERELIDLICKGKSNKEIGDALYISLQTVKHHIHSIYRKLKIKNRVQLANFFRNLGE